MWAFVCYVNLLKTILLMSNTPIIGITCGDINGVGTEILVKSVHLILQFDVKVIFFGSEKLFQFYDNKLNQSRTKYNNIYEIGDSVSHRLNIFNCLDDDIIIEPGSVSLKAGVAAYKSLHKATLCALNNEVNILITMPLNKHTVPQPFFGHTEYFRDQCNVRQNLMFLITEKLKLALVTNHVAINSVSSKVTHKSIDEKFTILYNSLTLDFSIKNPKIALLGLNPHIGDNKLIGHEENEIIIPFINKKKHEGFNIFGPYSADAFFANKQYLYFDAVLAMYHDQGLIPFKMLSSAVGGVNYTAGIPVIRVSPDHGPAYDIAGKDRVHCKSFLKSVKLSLEIHNNR